MKNYLLILVTTFVAKASYAQTCDASFSMSYDSTTNILSTIPTSNGNSIQHFWTVYLFESPAYFSTPLTYLPNGGIELRCPSGEFPVQICHRLIDTTTNCNVLDCDSIIIESHRHCNPYFFSVFEPTTAYYIHTGSDTNENDIWILNGDTVAVGDTNWIGYNLFTMPDDTVQHIVYDSLGCFASADNNYITGIIELVNSQIKIYPNPTSDLVNIESGILTGKAVVLSIVNSIGQVVFTKSIQSLYNREQIDLSDFPYGIYTIVISDGKLKGSARIVKSR